MTNLLVFVSLKKRSLWFYTPQNSNSRSFLMKIGRGCRFSPSYFLPFKEFTTLVGASSYPTLSTAYPLYSMLLRHMRGFSEDKDKVALVQPLFDSLRDNLATRFSQFPKIALLATMLDPRHKLMVPIY